MLRIIFAALVYIVGSVGPARANEYPTKPITIVAPSTPGGLVDLIARTIGERLSAAWGKPVVVENKSGANHQIGVLSVAKSEPDGHTLVISPEGPFVANPHLSKSPGPDLLKELVPVAGLFSTDAALVAANGLGVNDVKGLIGLAASKPNELSYGTFGFGSSGHLAMEMLLAQTGVKMVAVHYKGATPAFTDVLGGHIATMFVNPGTAFAAASQGKVKLLAIASRSRLPQYHDVPTMSEAGVSGFTAGSWFGLFAPASTPSAIVQKINQQIQMVLKELEKDGTLVRSSTLTPMYGGSGDFANFITEDSKKWASVIKNANIAPQ